MQTLHCTCGDWLSMNYGPFNQVFDGVRVVLDNAPLLVCPSCLRVFFPDLLMALVKDRAKEGKEKGKPLFAGRGYDMSLCNERFDFCKDAQFKYDATDWKYIPGLYNNFSAEGFFTPVFFNRRVLHKYMEFDEYRINIVSNTYGTIFHKDWEISFGINRGWGVFCWLGDLDKVPLNEQQYFLAENIESDHDVGSEFYSSQIEAEFTDFSSERELLNKRSAFDEVCNKMGFKIFHYKKDTYKVLGDLIRPVNWNEQGVDHVINALNKLCVESINCGSLKQEIKKLDESFDTGNLGGMKLMEKWIELCFANLDAKETMKPFFVLHDFRNILDHDMGQNDDNKINSCYERLGIDEPRDFETLYSKLIEEITKSYTAIVQ